MVPTILSFFSNQKWLYFFLISIAFKMVNSMFMGAKRLNRKRKSNNSMAIIELKGVLTEKETIRIIKELELVKESNYTILCLKLNTPGGLASSCTLIQVKLDELKKKGIKVIAFANGMCCSAGMHIACSADEIYATPDCIIGSIGVRFDVSDNDGLFKKIGIKKYSIAEGSSKVMFKDGEFLGEEMLRKLLKDSKKQFDIQASRGGKVDTSKEEIATSQIFSTKRGVELGLVDKIMITIDMVLEEENKKRKKKLILDNISNLEDNQGGIFSIFNKKKEEYVMSGLLFLAPFYH